MQFYLEPDGPGAEDGGPIDPGSRLTLRNDPVVEKYRWVDCCTLVSAACGLKISRFLRGVKATLEAVPSTWEQEQGM